MTCARRFVLVSLLLCVVGGMLGMAPAMAFAEPPALFEVKVFGVGSDEATLKAGIAPAGSDTTYKFEYGPTSGYGSSTAITDIGSGSPVAAQQRIGGLVTGGTYHFRAVATNASGATTSEDIVFTTFEATSLGLPDNRRYEKVSPNDNADGNVYPVVSINVESLSEDIGSGTELPFFAAADGNAFSYVADPPESGGAGRSGGGAGNQYVATRSAHGWTSVDVSPASDRFRDFPVYQGFSRDLSVGFLTDKKLTPIAPGAPSGGYSVLYEHNFGGGSYQPLITATPPNRGPKEFGSYETTYNSPVSGLETIYAGSSVDLKHVLYMANDALTPDAIDGGEEDNNLYDFTDGSPKLVNILPNGSPEPNGVFGGPVQAPDSREYDSPTLNHVISEDGSRIFWTGMSTGGLYLREDGTKTVQVDASVGGGGRFWTATPDGSKALFTKSGDLYEYDVNGAQTTDLTPAGEVQGVVGTSADLSYVYFVADAVLAAGAKPGSCVIGGFGEEDECNLYVLHAGDPIKFIARLASKDNYSSPTSFYNRDGAWQGDLGKKEAQVTVDGRHLVFGSVLPLTGYKSHFTEQIFVYDYEGDKLTCTSCKPTGELPTINYSAYLPVSHQATFSENWMSKDGGRVFFDSVDGLVPTDVNGQNDVYEWERDGAGNCRRSRGCVSLLSDGASQEGSTLADTSESGDDVFIVTRSKLVSEDQNENFDAYDVRVDAPNPPAGPQCTGTGCQGVPAAPPVFATPSSVTYNGVGNFAAPVKVVAKKVKSKKRHKKRKAKGGKASRTANAKKSATNNRGGK